jgi:hypothetical protein
MVTFLIYNLRLEKLATFFSFSLSVLTNYIGTMSIGDKLYQEHIVLGTFCVGNKLYLEQIVWAVIKLCLNKDI